MKKRDYKAEYQRRLKRGLARGLTASQSRGHPRKGEKPASRIKGKRTHPRDYVFPDSIDSFKGKPVPTDSQLIELLRSQHRYDSETFEEIADIWDEDVSDLYTLWLYL